MADTIDTRRDMIAISDVLAQDASTSQAVATITLMPDGQLKVMFTFADGGGLQMLGALEFLRNGLFNRVAECANATLTAQIPGAQPSGGRSQ